MLFSVIIPAYNTSEYIERCLDSVVGQSFCDLEIIIADDGSTDDTALICDGYARRHNNIRVLRIEHSGLGRARNKCLEYASGDYILFLDSDDHIVADSLKKIADAIDGRDVYLLQSQKVADGMTTEPLRTLTLPDISDFDEMLYELVKEEFFFCSACDKVVSRAFIEKHGIRFPDGRLNEDILWTLSLIEHANSVGAVNTPYYYYEQHRPGSLSRQFSAKNTEHIVMSLREGYEMTAKRGGMRKRAMLTFLAFQYAWIFPYYLDCKNAGTVAEAKNLAVLLKEHPRGKRLHRLIHVIGFDNACRLENALIKQKYRRLAKAKNRKG